MHKSKNILFVTTQYRVGERVYPIIPELAKKYNIKTIEDAAHAVRSTYKGEMIGNHSDYICFSFQAVKHLTTGDGGAIVSRSEEDIKRLRKLRWFGVDRHFIAPAGQPPASRWEQDIDEVGYKVHMNNINAAIAIINSDKANTNKCITNSAKHIIIFSFSV